MITAGLYPGREECAAAIAVDGRLISAVQHRCGVNTEMVDALSIALDDALDVGGIDLGEISKTTVVAMAATPLERRASGHGCSDLPWPCVSIEDHGRANAAQLLGQEGDGCVLVLDDGPSPTAAVFTKRDAVLDAGQDVSGSQPLMAALTHAAIALGGSRKSPIAALEEIADRSRSRPAEIPLPSIVVEGGQILLDLAMVTSAVDLVAAVPEVRQPRTVSVRALETRAGIANALLDLAAGALAEVLASHPAPGFRAVTGTAFAIPAFAERVLEIIPQCAVAPVPETVGATLGAALLPHERVLPGSELALGRRFSEQEIKDTLENCRLEYVYEPDWSKLLDRVSRLLSTGALVTWFQGRGDFGYRSFGSRSVLCDPSLKYARDNVNVFLLRRERQAHLPISLLGDVPNDGFQLVRPIPPQLESAVDRQGRMLCHTPRAEDQSQLVDLLQVHRTRTGVPGLINVPLQSEESRLASSVRDAVRASFASAVDVIVMGRFLVSKDYWLLRSR